MREACYAAYARVRAELTALSVDALVVYGTDHLNSYFFDLLPQWCLGRGDTFDGWADNVPRYTAKGHPELAGATLTGLLGRGFEPAFSDAMRLDHAFFSVLHFITPEMDVPIVPIFQNCIAPPYPTPARSYAFGKAVGDAIRASPTDARVAVIGSGGLSHWIGGPKHGGVDAEADREFLDRFAADDVGWLTGLDDATIERRYGNGGHELRNWLSVRGSLAGAAVEEFFYAPMHGWWLGTAVAALRPEPAT
jgi:aromatic ring-opening dioxygenase catalytic subunit (LigB family)